MDEKILYLVYVERINNIPNSQGFYEYEFFFSETPEIVWGIDWNQQCPSACSKENLRPEPTTYTLIEKLNSEIPLQCIGNNSCFSIQDSMDQIVSICWEDISEYEEYPSPLRLVFYYGESYNSVTDKLKQRENYFTEQTNENKENDGREITDL